MTRIRNLTRVDQVKDGDEFPIYQSDSGRPRSVDFGTMRDEISATVDAATAVAVAAAAAAEEAAASADATILRADLANPSDVEKGAAIIARGGQAIGSIAALRLLSKDSASKHVFVTGYYAQGDGGGGPYYLDSSDTVSTDNGGTVIVAADGGRWKLIHKGMVSIRQFGAVGDWNGTTGTDDTTPLRNCILAVQDTYIPDGKFLVASSGNITFDGLVGKKISGTGTLVKGGGNGIFWIRGSSGVEIEGIKFDGRLDWDEATFGNIRPDANRSPSNYAFAVFYERCTNCKVIDTTIDAFSWDGIVVQGEVTGGGTGVNHSTDIEIRGNTIRRVRGSMIWLAGVKRFSVEANKGINPDGFDQKANFIFVVDFNEDGKVFRNESYHIGDNAVGVGQMRYLNDAAVNKNIQVYRNTFDFTRYHAILISCGDNVRVFGNTISRAGAKGNMAGTPSVLVTGAILVLGGTDGVVSEPKNKDIAIECNNIIDPYEIGIYLVDRNQTPIADASTGISVRWNTITGAATLPLAGRLSAGGIRSQMQNPVDIVGNKVRDSKGRGIYVFGDAVVQNNEIENIENSDIGNDGYGIQLTDTGSVNLTVNRELSGDIERNRVKNTARTGIFVFDKDYAGLNGNRCVNCGIDTVPGTQNGSTASEYAGIAMNRVKISNLVQNRAKGSGSSGLVVYNNGLTTSSPVESVVNGENNSFNDNGKVFTDASLRSGAYLEGNATNNIKATFVATTCLTGTTQQYPLRALFAGSNCFSLDGRFDTHPNPSLGVTSKLISSIP